jgi:hypothetical protein
LASDVVTQSHFFIHRSPERRDFYLSARPVFWSEQLGCWVSATKEVILSVLKGKSFEVIDFKSETARLSQRLAIDLRATEGLLCKVPLGLRAPEHSAIRRRMAVNVSQNSSAALAQYREFVRARVVHAFNNRNSFNIVSEIFSPAVTLVMSVLSGIRLDAPKGDDSLPLIFDRMLSANRRMLLDRHIGATIKRHAAHSPVDDARLNTALSVIGSDSILGSLSQSFIIEIERNPGKLMSEIEWPDKLPATAVPYIERVAKNSCTLAGESIEEGQRIRLYLDTFASGDSDDLDYFFGAGPHVCVGKAVSLQAWRILTESLSTIARRVQITRIRYRKSDLLFNTPTVVEIACTDD